MVKNGPGTLELDISGYTAKEHSPLLVRFYFKKDHTKGIRAGTSQEASFDCYVSLASPAVGAIEVSAAEAKTGEEVQVKVSQWAALVYDSPGRPDLDDDPERVDESRFPDGTADEVKWTRKGKDESEAVEHDSGSESSYSHEAEEAEETEEPEETDDDDDDTPPEPRLFPFVFSAHVGDQADECSLLPEAEVCFVEEPEPQECEFKGLLGAYILDGDDADEPTTEHTSTSTSTGTGSGSAATPRSTTWTA